MTGARFLHEDAVPNTSRREGESELLYPATIRFDDGNEVGLLFNDNQMGEAMSRYFDERAKK